MKEAFDFLNSCGTFYLATVENNEPRVRPFGAVSEFDGKLYLVTSNQKDVYRQIKENNHVEICGMFEGKWMRIRGIISEDLRREARVAMLEANPDLSAMYSADDGLMTVLFFEEGEATLYSFTESPVVYKL